MEPIENYLKTYIRQIMVDLELDAISVYRRNENAKNATLIHWDGEEAPRASVPFNVTPLGVCLATGKPQLFSKKHNIAGKLQAQLVLPIKKEEVFVAALFLASYNAEYFQNKESISKCQSLAFHLAKLDY